MTKAEFLGVLKACHQKWHFTQSGAIRTESNDCPIVAVCFGMTGLKYQPVNFDAAASVLGLRREAYLQIAQAADGRRSKLRGKILEACGLKERAKT